MFTFVSNSGQIEGIVKDSRFLDKIYVNEEMIEFYIFEVMEEVIAEGFSGEDEFVSKFNEGFGRYGDSEAFKFFSFEGDLVKGDNVEIVDGEVRLKINFRGEEEFGERIEVVYSFSRVFVREV